MVNLKNLTVALIIALAYEALLKLTHIFQAAITCNFSPAFYNIMPILFFLTHAAIIYFLYRYYQVKFV
ncbi:MAG: hypothetical protein GWN62_28940 [Aliifodinibius sp.]|nr:hypothetical protein [Fodinibius sp.]